MAAVLGVTPRISRWLRAVLLNRGNQYFSRCIEGWCVVLTPSLNQTQKLNRLRENKAYQECGDRWNKK